jgi:hypothetical protein
VLAEHVLDVEELVRTLLCRECQRSLLLGEERLGRLRVGRPCRHADEFLLRVAKRGEATAEDAARVDVDRAVEPVGLGDRRVPVGDDRLAAVLRSPVPADREPELVGLTGRLAVEGKVAHLPRATALHLLLHAGVREHEVPVVEDEVADESVEEANELLLRVRANVVRERLDLRKRAVEPVGDLDVPPPQLPHELHVVVPRDAMGGARLDHVADEPNCVEDARAAVDEVAHEERLAPGGVDVDRAAGGEDTLARLYDLVAELAEELLELVAATVHVPDQVEGAVLSLPVVPEGRARDPGGVHFLGAREDVHLAEALAVQPLEGAAQIACLVADDVGAEVAVGTIAVSVVADALGQVEHDRDRQEVVLTRERDERSPVLALDACRVDYGESARGHALGGDEVEKLEGIGRSRLVVRVVGDEAAAEVRRDHLRRPEVLRRERRLAGARGADEDDERELWNFELAGSISHRRSKIPIWVGAPTVPSSGPTGRKRTA